MINTKSKNYMRELNIGIGKIKRFTKEYLVQHYKINLGI